MCEMLTPRSGLSDLCTFYKPVMVPKPFTARLGILCSHTFENPSCLRGLYLSFWFQMPFTHFSMECRKRDNWQTDPDQTPQISASPQGIHCLH